MGRWTQYDEDDYRLPEGMKRIGYDADTMQYSFRERDGNVWKGPEGAEFGEMTRVDCDRLPLSVVPDDDEKNRGDYVEAHTSPHTGTQSRCYEPLFTEPSRPMMADRSTINIGLFSLLPYYRNRPSPYLPIISGVWWSRRDSRFLQENVRKDHHLTGPSLATVAGKYRERRLDGRSKISKKSIQMSFVRSVAARLPSFRVKPLQPS